MEPQALPLLWLAVPVALPFLRLLADGGRKNLILVVGVLPAPLEVWPSLRLRLRPVAGEESLLQLPLVLVVFLQLDRHLVPRHVAEVPAPRVLVVLRLLGPVAAIKLRREHLLVLLLPVIPFLPRRNGLLLFPQ